MPQNDLIEKLSVKADSLDEAVQFVVSELQSIASSRGSRGFLVPVLTQESIELIDGEWAHVFEFSAELLPGAPMKSDRAQWPYCVHGFTGHCAEIAL